MGVFEIMMVVLWDWRQMHLRGVLPRLKPLEGLKQLESPRSLREFEPIQPVWAMEWLHTPLCVCLASGRACTTATGGRARASYEG